MNLELNTPWFVDSDDDCLVIRDQKPSLVVAAPIEIGLQASIDQEAIFHLLSRAPELFEQLTRLVDVVRRAEAGLSPSREITECTEEEYEDAVQGAEALLAYLAGWIELAVER